MFLCMNIVVRLNSGASVTLDVDQIVVTGRGLAFWRRSSLLAEIMDSEIAAIALGVDAVADADGEGTPSYSVAVIRETYPNAYARWTDLEDAQLLESRAQQVPIARIAAAHGRQESAIRSRIRRLVPEPDELDGEQSADKSGITDRTVRFG
jgi:hypothetical protein